MAETKEIEQAQQKRCEAFLRNVGSDIDNPSAVCQNNQLPPSGMLLDTAKPPRKEWLPPYP